MTYRRRPGDTVWHHNPDCWDWPGGSYEGRAEAAPGGVICFECTDRRRAAQNYMPPLPANRGASEPVTEIPALARSGR